MSSSFKRRRGKKVVSSPIPSSLASASSNSNEPTTKISSSLLPGTKHWTNNLTLTSFGLREIDSFFFSSGGGNDAGGGQPLQTCVMLEEDRLTDDIARALSRYWCAEGVAQRQMVLMASLLPEADASLQLLDDGTDSIHSEGSTPDELHDFILSLPRNLHLDKFRAKEAKKHSSNAVSSTTNENAIDGNDMMSSNNRESISAIIEEDEEEEEDERSNDGEVQQSKDEGLINAW